MTQQSIQSARSAANTQRTAGWGHRLTELWRALAGPRAWSGQLPAPTSTVSAQLWVSGSPARLTAGWVFLAALIAGGILNQVRAPNWQQLALLWLLVDLLWGSLWRMAGGRNHLLPLRTAASGDAALKLPYLRPGSPAAQLLSLDESNSLPFLVRVALPALLVTLIVAAVLGLPALLLTLLVAGVTVGGWILRRTLTLPPLFLHAVVLVALPWLATLLQMGVRSNASVWPAAVAVGAFWTLHAWGEARAGTWPEDRLALILLGAAQLGVLLVLILNKTPIWVPIVAVLLLPTWLRALRRQPLAGLSIWWTAALFVSALALGWR